MLFGIAIVVIAVIIAVILNKSNVSSATKELESKVQDTIESVEAAIAPAVEEIQEITHKASKVLPENKLIKKVEEVEKKIAVKTKATANKKVDKKSVTEKYNK
jgi:hypothetical protein